MNKEELKKEIEEIEKDERLSYPAATIFENAPLALVQLELETRLKTLKRCLKVIEKAQSDFKKKIDELKEDHSYSTTKRFWDRYEKIVSFFIKFCKNKNQKAEFMQLLDDLYIEEDLISFNDLKEIFPNEDNFTNQVQAVKSDKGAVKDNPTLVVSPEQKLTEEDIKKIESDNNPKEQEAVQGSREKSNDTLETSAPEDVCAKEKGCGKVFFEGLGTHKYICGEFLEKYGYRAICPECKAKEKGEKKNEI